MTSRHPTPRPFTRTPSAGRPARRRLVAATIDALEQRRLLTAFTVDAGAPVAGANYATIADAVQAAASDTADPLDTIDVAAGGYAENVVIDSPLVLRGAQFAADPVAGRAGPESIVTGQIAIASAGVTVGGFTIVGGAAGTSAPIVSGVHVAADDAIVTRNVLTGTAGAGVGVLVAEAAGGATQVAQNLITGFSTGVDVRAAGTVTLAGNAIRNHALAGVTIDLLAVPAASTVALSGNAFDNPGAPQVNLLGGTPADSEAGTPGDVVNFVDNAVTLAGTATFVAGAASTPTSGLSRNTFTLLRTTAEDVPLAIDLDVDGTGFNAYEHATLAGSLSGDGSIITYVPTPNFNGATSFNFTTTGVTVNGDTFASTGVVLITVTAANDAPTSTAIPAQSALSNQTRTLPLASYFADVDAGDAVPDVLSYALSGAPAFVSVDPTTGVVTIAPTAADVGAYSFVASATDGDETATRPVSLTIVRAANGAPVFVNLPGMVTIPENALAPVLDVDATDPDGDAVTYAIVAGNAAGLFAIDAATGLVTLVAPLDAEAAGSYALTIRAADAGDPTPAAAEATLTVAVADANESAGSVSISGPAAGFEGAPLTFLATAADPDVGASFAYRWFVDNVEQPGQTAASFTFAFADEGTYDVRVEARDRDGPAVSAALAVSIGDAAPVIPLAPSAAAVDEAQTLGLTIGKILDSGAGDVGAIGQLVVDWGDGLFTIINAGTDPDRLASVRAGVPIDLAHVYSDGANLGRTIEVRVWDADGRSFAASTTVLVRNVAPTGSFVAVTPTVSSGSSAIVNWFGQTDASAEDRAAGLRYTFAIDGNGNGRFDAGETLIAGDGTYAGSVSTSQVTIPRALISSAGTYSILGLLFDKDAAPFLTRAVNLTVTPGPFRVLSLGGDHSGFTVTFNQSIDRAPLNLYDGTDAAVDATDVILTRANGQVLKGTIVFNAAGNGFDFIVSGGIISSGTYTVTLRSGDNAFQDLLGNDLDGDFNGTAGGTYVSIFGVNAPPGPVLSLGDFSRGPGQSVDVIPGNSNSDLPVFVNSPIAISSLNFQIRYDPSLLTVRPADGANGVADVYAGAGLPAGWSVDYSVAGGAITVSLIKVSPAAPDIAGGFRELVKIRASVPNDPAIYGRSQYLAFSTMVVNGNASIEGTGDRAVHHVVFLGDANLDGTVDAGDAALIQSVVLGSVTGFDRHPMIDPTVVVDSSRNAAIDAQDATNAALSGFTGGRPADVPAFAPIVLTAAPGSGATLEIGRVYASPGTTIGVPIDVIDDARGVQGGVIRVSYDPDVLDPADVGVIAGPLIAAGWTILTRVDEAAGFIEFAFFSGSAIAGPAPVAGTLATLRFDVRPGAPDGDTALTIAEPTGDASGLTALYDRQGGRRSLVTVAGAVVIDTVAPTAAPATFDVSGVAQTLAVTFSEDVRAGIAAGDFELLNLTSGASVELVIAGISADGRTVTLAFANTGGVTGSVLRDGNYRLRLRAGQAADPSGNVNADAVDSSFFFLNGDANHDGTVNFADLVILAQNYNQTGRTFAQGNLDYSPGGGVTFSDLVILAQHYNQTLAPASAVAAAPPAGTPGTARKRVGGEKRPLVELA